MRSSEETRIDAFQGKKNIYVCQACGRHIATVDRDGGVTPFMVRCEEPRCGGMMHSMFYRVDQAIRPDHEWYRPGATEKLSIGAREHVSKGGLLLRRIPIATPEDDLSVDHQPVGKLEIR